METILKNYFQMSNFRDISILNQFFHLLQNKHIHRHLLTMIKYSFSLILINRGRNIYLLSKNEYEFPLALINRERIKQYIINIIGKMLAKASQRKVSSTNQTCRNSSNSTWNRKCTMKQFNHY